MVEDYKVILDVISENEMRQFETKNFKLRKTAVYKPKYSDVRMRKMFWFETEEEMDIWFHFYLTANDGIIRIMFEVNTYHYSGGITVFDEVLVAHKYKELERFISFFKQKEEAIKKEIKTNHKTRMHSLFLTDIVFVNFIEENVRKIKEYYYSHDYKSRKKFLLSELERVKMQKKKGM